MKKLFAPTYRFPSLYEIEPDFFRQAGIRLLILDIDNTLVPHGAPACARAVDGIARLTDSGVACGILSNNNQARVEGFCASLPVYAVFRGKKPLPGGYRRVMAHFGVSARETAAIGDQRFTDILGANLAGIRSILVQPLHPDEPPFIRFKRKLERVLFDRRQEGK